MNPIAFYSVISLQMNCLKTCFFGIILRDRVGFCKVTPLGTYNVFVSTHNLTRLHQIHINNVSVKVCVVNDIFKSQGVPGE